LQFTINEETNNTIAYLDLELTNKKEQLELNIYRKPTTTDTTLNFKSCHPKEQKMAAYKSWLHRLDILPLSTANKNEELNTIIHIGVNNGYKKEEILRLYNKIKNRRTNRENTDREQKWISFTYAGHYIRKITKLFKDTNLRIAYRTSSTLDKILKETHKMNPYEQSGIYRLICQSCHKVYIGQTGRTLSIRYKEHIRNIRSNKDDSAFEQHILDNQHQYGPMTTIMKIVEQAKKGTIMNIKENFHIYQQNKLNMLIEEQKANIQNHTQNEMFDLTTHIHTRPQITS
jgi:hypothetical protein